MMSKYVRTKDGKIFDTHALDKYNSLEPRFIIEENRLIIFDLRDERLIANHGEVLKQADTIEELCDEFVLIDTESGYCGILPKDKEIKFNKVNMGNAYGRKFYGAIWTDKGLIYVAKINNKGEFELL